MRWPIAAALTLLAGLAACQADSSVSPDKMVCTLTPEDDPAAARPLAAERTAVLWMSREQTVFSDDSLSMSVRGSDEFLAFAIHEFFRSELQNQNLTYIGLQFVDESGMVVTVDNIDVDRCFTNIFLEGDRLQGKLTCSGLQAVDRRWRVDCDDIAIRNFQLIGNEAPLFQWPGLQATLEVEADWIGSPILSPGKPLGRSVILPWSESEFSVYFNDDFTGRYDDVAYDFNRLESGVTVRRYRLDTEARDRTWLALEFDAPHTVRVEPDGTEQEGSSLEVVLWEDIQQGAEVEQKTVTWTPVP